MAIRVYPRVYAPLTATCLLVDPKEPLAYVPSDCNLIRMTDDWACLLPFIFCEIPRATLHRENAPSIVNVLNYSALQRHHFSFILHPCV